MKYRLTGLVSLTLETEVEANSIEEAREKAEEKFIAQIKSGEVSTFNKDDLVDSSLFRVYDEDDNELEDHDDEDPPLEG